MQGHCLPVSMHCTLAKAHANFPPRKCHESHSGLTPVWPWISYFFCCLSWLGVMVCSSVRSPNTCLSLVTGEAPWQLKHWNWHAANHCSFCKGQWWILCTIWTGLSQTFYPRGTLKNFRSQEITAKTNSLEFSGNNALLRVHLHLWLRRVVTMSVWDTFLTSLLSYKSSEHLHIWHVYIPCCVQWASQFPCKWIFPFCMVFPFKTPTMGHDFSHRHQRWGTSCSKQTNTRVNRVYSGGQISLPTDC